MSLRKVVVKEYLTTTQHGAISGKTQVHSVKNYNLDVIISVGYRIKSIQGTRFRQWANQVLKEHLFVKANLPPSEGLLPAHAHWSGYEFAVQLVRSAL